MIRIIAGKYGYKNAKGVIEPKTSKDAPFSLPDAKEESLVARGIAVKVDEVKMGASVEKAKNAKVAQVQQDKKKVKGYLDKEELNAMDYNDLKKLAAKLGIPAKGTREELVEKIAATEVEAEEVDEAETETVTPAESDDTPPEIAPADPE